MEHYRATLATTACAVFGLVVAAHILHPGNYQAESRPAKPPVSAVATAWVDPPADLRVATVTPKRSVEAVAATPSADLLQPRMVAALQPGETMAPTLASAIAAPPQRARKSAAVHRRKPAPRITPTRQASLDRDSVQVQPASLRTETPQQKTKIDPIGDLIRGLGFGGEG